jgi:MoaA/NifB/PqqE/SkfB family radical SAM enzyme
MCNQWGGNGVYRKHRDKSTLHMPFERFCALYDEACRFKGSVVLMGGEPMVHPEFDKILRWCQKNPLSVTIGTNGTLIEEYADLLAQPPMHSLEISIDGPEETHDKVRGRGTFRTIFKGLATLRECAAKSGYMPRIQVRCTILPENVGCLAEFGRLLADKGIDLLSFQHLIYHNPNVDRENERVMREEFGIVQETEGDGLLPRQDINGEEVLRQIRALRQENLGFPIVMNPTYNDEVILEYYAGGAIRRPQRRCYIPYQQISVDYGGYVTSCGVYFGDAFENGLLKIWRSKGYRSFRKNMDRVGSIPLCKICCYPD